MLSRLQDLAPELGTIAALFLFQFFATWRGLRKLKEQGESTNRRAGSTEQLLRVMVRQGTPDPTAGAVPSLPPERHTNPGLRLPTPEELAQELERQKKGGGG